MKSSRFLPAASLLLFASSSFAPAAAATAVVASEFIYETAPFASCHATTIVETKSGLVSAWFGGTKEGAPDVGIWLSRQIGGKWTPPTEVANGVGADGQRFACFNPVLFQPRGGALLLFYKVGGHPNGWAGLLKTSTDDGATWSAAKPLPAGFVGPVKNKPVQLADGTLLCPSSLESAEKPSRWQVQFERSADLGKTWTKTEFLNDGLEISAIQPSILTLGGDRLLALGRTRQARLFRTSSADGGKTWSPLTLTDLPNPNSGTDAVTLKDGRHLLIYNHTAKGRSPLNLAVSRDGEKWEGALVLETDKGEYSYPAIIQTSDGLVHATYTWKRERPKHVVIDPAKLQSQPIANGVWPSEIFDPAAPGSAIRTTLQPFVDSQTLAGAVTLVASPDGVLDVQAVGWADVAAKKPLRTDSVFWIASQSKPITGAALMILVDEGKVNVNDPVENYLPEFKGQMVAVEQDAEHALLRKPRHPILVREVLSHTSGLPFKSAIEQPTLDLYPLELRVRSYAMMPLLFEPGTKSQYSNAGINTVGRIIEVVSGMPYEKFVEERLLKPLGMNETTFWPSGALLARLAKAYKPTPDGGLEETPIAQLKYPLDSRERQPMPAGGLFSTANDLSVFYRMLANGGQFEGKRVLSEMAVAQMTSDQSGEAHSNYGFGIGSNGSVITHGGAYNTNSAYDRERKLITIFLVQHAGWGKNGKEILPTFKKAANAAFGGAGAGAEDIVVGIPKGN